MICFQNGAGFLQIPVISGFFVPGEPEKRLNIAADNTALRGISHDIFQPSDFLPQGILYHRRSLQRICLLPVPLKLRLGIILAQLFPDQFQLFPQDIFLLIFVNPCLNIRLELRADFLYRRFICQHRRQKVISL